MRSDNKTGICGVTWDKKSEKWHPFINIGKKLKHLGLCDDFFEAICRRKSAELIHGYHPNHGLPYVA